MEPNKTKNTKEADKDPKIVEPNEGTPDLEERGLEGDGGSQDEDKKEPYVDFSKLF